MPPLLRLPRFIVPTGVGVNRSCAGAVVEGPYRPHRRGGEPDFLDDLEGDAASSPQAWG